MFMVAIGEFLWPVVVLKTQAPVNQLHSVHEEFLFVNARPRIAM
jgi:hypothetical protein